MEKQNKNFFIWGLIILIICVVIFGVWFGISKLDDLKDVKPNESGENLLPKDEDKSEYNKVNIDVKNCLPKEEIKELFELGEFSDNEMLVYKNDDKENPIEVWKIKLEDGQDSTLLMRKLTVRRQIFIEEFEDNPKLKEILESSEGNTLNCIKDELVTLIVSNHLEEVREQTNNWLRE